MKKTVVITGASSGIGAAIAEQLSSEWHVVLVARRADRLAAITQKIQQRGGAASAIEADLTTPDVAQKIIQEAIAKTGRLDALINNAGVLRMASVTDIDQSHIDSMWQLNVTVPMLLSTAAIPHLEKNGGDIIMISSVASHSTFSGCAVYSASKSAIETWSRIAREELRAKKIRVGVIAPGATDTEVWPADSTFDRSRMSTAADIAQVAAAMLAMPARTSFERVVVAPAGGAL